MLTPLENLIFLSKDINLDKMAPKLGLSSEGLRKQLQSLERKLGFKIFERHAGHKFTRLTPAGQYLALHGKDLLNEYNFLMHSIRYALAPFSGELNIAVTPTIGEVFLPKWLGSFHHIYPNVTFNVEILSAQAIDNLDENLQADLALVETSVCSQYETGYFHTDRCKIIRPYDWFTTKHELKRANMPWVVNANLLEKMFWENNIVHYLQYIPKTILLLPNNAAVLDGVGAGLGCGLVTEALAVTGLLHKKVGVIEGTAAFKRSFTFVRRRYTKITDAFIRIITSE